MAERLPSSKSMLRSRSQDERSDRRRTSTASSRDEEIEETLQRIQKQGKYVKLNVGGVLYCTTLGTLTKYDNMLRAMFSERIPLQKDEEGENEMLHGGLQIESTSSRTLCVRLSYTVWNVSVNPACLCVSHRVGDH